MTKEQIQLDEMVNAIQQVTAVAEKKSAIETKREVIAIINDGLSDSLKPLVILQNLAEWAGK
jgi:hypothetical protein